MISTVKAIIDDKSYDTGFHVTTPNPFHLQKYFKIAQKKGEQYMVFEVTSHALDQFRTLGTSIDIAVVTNISHEHLDYHKTIDKYKNAKTKILKGVKFSVLNKDDEYFDYFKNHADGAVITYGINTHADFTKNKFSFESPLIGTFNDYNILAAVAVAKTLGVEDDKIRQALKSFKGIKGRMEEVKVNRDFRVFLDFAHKPNALENALKAMRSLTLGKVIVVFGCAGLRDVLKRPMMGKIAGKLADYTVLTAEDPRTEDVRDIINQIALGCKSAQMNEADKLKEAKIYLKSDEKYFWRIPDRQEAINFAIRKIAQKNDSVLITGKGHETSMCYGKIEYPWSDAMAIQKALNDKNNKA